MDVDGAATRRGQQRAVSKVGPPEIGVDEAGAVQARAPQVGFREVRAVQLAVGQIRRSEEHTSELQSLMRISYAVFCLKKKKKIINTSSINRKEQTTK